MAELQEWIARALKESESRLEGRIAALETALVASHSEIVETAPPLGTSLDGDVMTAAASASSELESHGTSNAGGTSVAVGGSGASVTP